MGCAAQERRRAGETSSIVERSKAGKISDRVARRGTAASRCRGDRLADRLGQHEAHVLAYDVELRDVGDPARAEEGEQVLHQVVGGGGTRADADDALVRQPLLAYLAGVVD